MPKVVVVSRRSIRCRIKASFQAKVQARFPCECRTLHVMLLGGTIVVIVSFHVYVTGRNHSAVPVIVSYWAEP
jgi:hypothetical protein